MNEAQVIIEVYFEKQEGDCSRCATCEDMIFGNKYVMVAKVVNRTTELLQLCESCFDNTNEYEEEI